jgi:mitochondrial import receptor subunit TOM40
MVCWPPTSTLKVNLMVNSDKNNTTGFKLTNGIFNFSHMERVTRNLILGFDYNYLVYFRFIQTQQGISLFGYGAKFNYKAHHFFAQYMPSQGSTNLAYSVPIKKGTMFVSNFCHEKLDNKTTSILGIKQRYTNSEIIATINSRGKITTALTLYGAQAPYSLKLCSIVDYLKDTYKFGYGITIGQAN